MIIDTGSSTTWVFGENCEECVNEYNHKLVRKYEGDKYE